MEKELFHIHLIDSNNKNHKWDVGKSIIIDESFDSTMNRRHQNFNQCIEVVDGNNSQQIQFYQYLVELFMSVKDRESVSGYDFEDMKPALENAYKLSYNASFFKRETGLEDYRKDNCKQLPSRLHSIYLCDEDGLEYWLDTITYNRTKNYDIYKVLVEGNIFKTNEQLLPIEESNYGQIYQESFRYWNPKFKTVPNYTNEYLAQGKVKVLERVKNNYS